MNKKVLITGIGQIGSFLIEHLIALGGYDITAIYEHELAPYAKNHLNVNCIKHNLTKKGVCEYLIKTYLPDFCINTAANSSVSQCKNFNDTIKVNTLVVGELLEAILKYKPDCKFCNCGSEQEFGGDNFYALSKILSHKIVAFYRDKKNLFAIQPFIYPAISERQSINSFCNKVVYGAVAISRAVKNNNDFNSIIVGNLDIQSDFLYAGETAEILWRILNLNKLMGSHMSIAGGGVVSNRDFIKGVFRYLKNIEYQLSGKPYLIVDESLIRPNELNRVCDDNSLKFLKTALNWTPKYNIDDIIKIMVENAIKTIDNHGKL